jgi:hypothetical protein
LLPLALLVALAQDNCGQAAPPPSPPPPPPPPAAPAPAPPAAEEPAPPAKGGAIRGGKLRSRLFVRWEEGPPITQLRIDYAVENTGDEAVTVGFSNSGRVCGVVRDAEGREVYQFPEITAQVMGDETFRPGEERLFSFKVRQAELAPKGEVSLSYSVEAWLCGQRELKRQATAKVRSAL